MFKQIECAMMTKEESTLYMHICIGIFGQQVNIVQQQQQQKADTEKRD